MNLLPLKIMAFTLTRCLTGLFRFKEVINMKIAVKKVGKVKATNFAHVV